MPDYFDTGFSVRQPMWHGLGDILDEYPDDWADARAKAGLLWEPVEAPSWVRRPVADLKCRGCEAPFGDGRQPHTMPCLVNESGMVKVTECAPEGARISTSRSRRWAFVEDTNHLQILRSDTGAVLGAGLSSGYRSITHGLNPIEGGGSMEQIIDAFADRALLLETAGSVKGGRQVWALLKLDEPFTVPGDESPTIPYLALLNSHDGSGALTAVATQVRVVCWNTYQMALADGRRTGMAFTFRHTGDVGSRIEDARLALSGLRTEADKYRELCVELSTLAVSPTAIDAFLTDFLPNPAEHGHPTTERVQANIERARSTFRELYEGSVTTDGIRGTGYGLFMAATEYLDHVRVSRSSDSLLGRSVLGSDRAKANALPLVRRHAGVGA